MMDKQLDQITPELQAFIEKQPLFFVGTAAEEGRVKIIWQEKGRRPAR